MFNIISLALFFLAIFWLDKTCYPVVSQRGIMALFPTFFHSFKWFDWNFYKTWRIAWLNINSWAQNSFFECIRYWFTSFGQWSLWRNLRSALFFISSYTPVLFLAWLPPRFLACFWTLRTLVECLNFDHSGLFLGQCVLFKGKTHEIRHVIFGIKHI